VDYFVDFGISGFRDFFYIWEVAGVLSVFYSLDGSAVLGGGLRSLIALV